ncbi:hypothetical protein BDV96DRAFT_145371 [Lophiotrema nucula]|uniref:Rhodopsin domain-containing protein n=1 Tax=Lophiotrema nucula TaxID=690887 RepID=A0A6A5Z3H7_9PLEO|nr:hypothetical protein BDV96DRAFT_145371 [Lophiotrema nucula]
MVGYGSSTEDLRALDKNDAGRHLLIVLTVFLFFDFVFIGIRLYARHIKKRYLELNDWAILIGFIVLLVIYALQVVQVVYAGLGLPSAWIIQYLGLPRFQFVMKCVFASNILWNISIMAIKISILHLYLSIFSSVLAMKRIVWATIILSIIIHTAFIIEILAICKPIAYFWELGFTSLKGSCPTGVNSQMARFIPGVLSLILDVVIFVLPLPVLWTLRMPTNKKVATTAVFGIALGIVIVSAVRLRYIFIAGADIEFAITGAVEPMVGIIVCCTPMLQPVLAHLSGGRVVLWASRRSTKATPNSTANIKSNLSWPHASQKSYVSAGRSPGNGFERMEDGDERELIEMETKRDGRETPEEDGGNWISVAEEGRIRITRDIIVDTRPKSSRTERNGWK